MKYKVGSKNKGSQFIDVELSFSTIGKKQTVLQLPTWRPGRYELGNFAKNIRAFQVFDAQNKAVPFQKTSTHTWVIESKKSQPLRVVYQYYANELNAGSTWVDGKQLYINPVNCLMYIEGMQNEPCELSFDVPRNYIIATALSKNKQNIFTAKNFDELADSPAICSATIKHGCYKVQGVDFHVWFQGECQPTWEKLIADFSKFTEKQLETMSSFPFKSYHFLFQIVPYQAYHGVEHSNSTVILLGPSYDVMNLTFYEELLGVSSHELFHAWNVKSIRPADMLPYDFTKENYTELGYLTEGVTTYLGDLFLSKSNIFNEERYVKELHKLLDRHSLNYGRFNYSVCESSFDTWLDGYSKGIPNRKGSIYTEGALLALCIDLLLINNSKATINLGKVMQVLFKDYALKEIGITEEIIIKTIEDLGGSTIQSIFTNYYHQAVDYFALLKSSLKWVGLNLNKQVNENFLAGKLGCYTDTLGKVLSIAPNSPADQNNILLNDEIIAVNGNRTTNNCINWCNYFKDELTLTFKNEFGTKSIQLTPLKEDYFEKYRITPVEKPSAKQKLNKEFWLG